MTDFHSATPALSAAINERLDFAPPGAYYEFGLYQGYTLWAVQQHAMKLGRDMWYYGFDSFRGIPPNDSGQWLPGEFECSRDEVLGNLFDHGADMSSVKLFEGWFSVEHFAGLLAHNAFEPAAVVVIDSDLYESCVPALWFVGRFLQPGTFVFFDDWKAYGNSPDAGEQLAWSEYLSRHENIRAEPVADFCRAGHIEIIRSMT